MQAPIVEIRMPAKLEEHHLNEESKIKAATKGRGQSCWKLTGKIEFWQAGLEDDITIWVKSL